METVIFRRSAVGKDILKVMELSMQEMIEKGLWKDDLTFEEWAHYAGSHIIIRDTKSFQDYDKQNFEE